MVKSVGNIIGGLLSCLTALLLFGMAGIVAEGIQEYEMPHLLLAPVYAFLLLCGSVLLLRLGMRLISGGFLLFRVNCCWPAAVLLSWMLGKELLWAWCPEAGRWGMALHAVSLCLLVWVCRLGRKVKAPAP